MTDYSEILQIPPYSLDRREKQALLTERLDELTAHHIACCPEYARMMRAYGYDGEPSESLAGLPFLPVSLFKLMRLSSIPESEIFKIMTSSGTSGQAVSKIYLDRKTSANQQKTLVKIVSAFTGSARMPMIIIDSPSVISNRAMFSARGAGILGFSVFASDKIYALNDDMTLNMQAINDFLQKHSGKRILLFGFTFMIWEHFYNALRQSGERPDISNGVLIHGGGWKKLVSRSVSKEKFAECLNEVCGLSDIHDYYGMVEQTGCIYMECEHGHLHASVFSDIITRRAKDFLPCEIGEKGIIQVLSAIPESYPGHSLLTEDEGTVLGEDDCPCGRKGKYFSISGRLRNAEIRGCSDTYAVKF